MKVDKNYLKKLRHSCAHLLAAAVLDLFPKALPTIGPSIENGFYYDFDNLKISDSDLPKIEGKMKQIVKDWKKFERSGDTDHQSKKLFAKNKYKLELISEFEKEGKEVTLYKSGNFIDLCRGRHIENPSKELKHFKLLSIAGAYWRGNEKNKMLTRIYGTCWPTKEELEAYLNQLEEAKKRDHRKLGKELGLWTFSENVGAGLPLFTIKGALVRRLINEFVENLQEKQGIHQVWTPQIAKAGLFKTSGHYDKYRDSMFRVHSNYSDEEFYLKPMNCPQHTQIYAATARSYKDLPIRLADFAMLYRDEKTGELMGLNRTRSFSQDDCHIFCREDQVEDEMNKALDMTKQIMDCYGFSYKYRLSTRDTQHPEKYLGSPKNWHKAEKISEKVLKERNLKYVLGPGEAAFYAPKLDLIATDSLGREWQLSTLQVDYVMPERFNLSYVDKDGSKKTPVMLHRAISGSPERLMAILIEHFAGAFPVWLSPVQVKVLPVSEKSLKYAREVSRELLENNIRVEIDNRNETLPAKIRDAQLEKVPYMAVVGEKEEKVGKVAVRLRDGKDLGLTTTSEFIARVQKQIDSKSLDL